MPKKWIMSYSVFFQPPCRISYTCEKTKKERPQTCKSFILSRSPNCKFPDVLVDSRIHKFLRLRKLSPREFPALQYSRCRLCQFHFLEWRFVQLCLTYAWCICKWSEALQPSEKKRPRKHWLINTKGQSAPCSWASYWETDASYAARYGLWNCSNSTTDLCLVNEYYFYMQLLSSHSSSKHRRLQSTKKACFCHQPWRNHMNTHHFWF